MYRGQISATAGESEFCNNIEDRLYGETDQSLIHVWAIYKYVMLSKLLNFFFFTYKIGIKISTSEVDEYSITGLACGRF